MAIPDRPLDLNIDVNDLANMTLDEVAILDLESAAAYPFTWVNQMRRFLIKYSLSWTVTEINAITLGEMREIARQTMTALGNIAVPLADEPPSKTGDG